MATLAAFYSVTALLRDEPEFLSSVLGGIPIGALTEIAGPVSSGRTTVLCALLAEATAAGGFCALIDTQGAFDPASAAAAGVRLSQVLWVRCSGNPEHALKAADMLAQAGGFGLVALDLADTPVKISRRIPLAAWFRLRRAVENTKTALVSVGACFNASTSAALKIELARGRAVWRGRLLEGMEITAQRTRHHQTRLETFVAMWGGPPGPRPTPSSAS
jgi:recombination protein RecA